MNSSVKQEHYHLPCRFAVVIALGNVFQIFGNVKSYHVACAHPSQAALLLVFVVSFVSVNVLAALTSNFKLYNITEIT